MPDFLSLSACKGFSPRYLSTERHVARPALIARLLRERHVPRYIVAPPSYGKTILALQYASTVFSFKNVFWLDCASPCFFRDLDAHIIAERLKPAEGQTALVIFDGMPFLDPHRADFLMDEIDAILDGGGEVLVTCTPSRDVFSAHRDRMRIGSRDLLLSDDELDDVRTESERKAFPSSFISDSGRVPGIAWADAASSTSAFVAATFGEELPADMLASIFVMMVLGDGKLAHAMQFVSSVTASLRMIECEYPHFGVDVEQGTFEAPAVPIADIEGPALAVLPTIVDGSAFAGRESLCSALGSWLVQHGRASRACELMHRLPGAVARALWLAEHGEDLLDACCVLPASEVFGLFSETDQVVSSCLQADEALRLLLLDDVDGALRVAGVAVSRADASAGDRMQGMLVTYLASDAAERTRVAAAAAHLFAEVGESQQNQLDPDAAHQGEQDGQDVDVHVVDVLRFIGVLEALSSSTEEALRLQCEWLKTHPSLVCLLAAAVVFNRIGCMGSEGEVRFSVDVETQARRIALQLEQLPQISDPASLTLPAALAAIELSRMLDVVALPVSSVGTHLLDAAQAMEMSLYKQRREYRKDVAARSSLTASTRRNRSLLNTPLKPQVKTGVPTCPPLHVSLFGGLEVSIGEHRVDPMLFSRRKVRTLLALLVLNGGKEYSRDRLATLLWPDSSPTSARNNLYSIWSTLRKALSVPGGGCPYLIRQQQGLRIDATLLTSDVTEFDELCRTLLFESPGYGGWSHIHAQLKANFSEDLLPSEDENEFIAGMRNSYRGRLVDALVSASKRLVGADEVREGLWFARAAVMRDRTREDAYDALMEAQLAAGQRTAALDTYFECRRVLINEMGIDPSPETVRMYRLIIEAEDDLSF
ncbi:BTAD domain-containing putative transcriptional regulator [Adlercreutzia sp. ZJ138]|uniref:AfsR/SARP family transcriptional regulator n=1 Tax=Adlercreutzia sp. ZJ138 TaxID=2709405 RepID=UPI0013EABBED|nr:BTAD domain-containing putative transcriptional regulator [Adlercreutzia sp. ZJ138]